MKEKTKLTKEYYDKLGKDILTTFFIQYHCPYHFTEYKYSKLDVYFGNQSVGEIKYRLTPYSDYIIEENKVISLEKDASVQKYYIVVLDEDIYFYSIHTIKSNIPTTKYLPLEFGGDEKKLKKVRYLSTEDADFHFHFSHDEKKWKLIQFLG